MSEEEIKDTTRKGQLLHEIAAYRMELNSSYGFSKAEHRRKINAIESKIVTCQDEIKFINSKYNSK